MLSFIDGPSSIDNAVHRRRRISEWVFESCQISIKSHMKHTPISDTEECEFIGHSLASYSL